MAKSWKKEGIRTWVRYEHSEHWGTEELDRLTIEKGIPLPENQFDSTGTLKDVVSEMEVGDSVLVSYKKNIKGLDKAQAFIQVINKVYGAKSGTSKKMSNGYRVWRKK